MGPPAVARARRSRSRCSSHDSRSARPGAAVTGVRAPALPPNSRADFLLPPHGLSTGEQAEFLVILAALALTNLMDDEAVEGEKTTAELDITQASKARDRAGW